MIEVRHPLTACAPGTTRELVSLHYGPGGGAKAYLQAALHADEPPGLLVAWHLRALLAELEAAGRLRGEIVLVPMANPLGHAQRLLGRAIGRFDLPGGENFNRQYANLAAAAYARLHLQPGAPLPSVAEVRAALREACADLPVLSELASLRATLLGLAVDADHVLDLHCDNDAVMHLYTTPSLWPRVEPLARLLGAELALVAGDSGGDPFDESCSLLWSRLNALHADAGEERWPEACVAVTVELRGEIEVDHALALADARALVGYLATQGYVDGPLPELPPLKRPPRPFAGSMPIYAPHGGVVAYRCAVGSELAAGDPVADIIDPLSGVCSTLVAPVDGLLYAREIGRVAHAGQRIAKVAGTQPMRSGPLLSA